MKTVILNIKSKLSELDNTSSKIFLIGIMLFECTMLAAIVLFLFSAYSSDADYYMLRSAGEVVFGTGARVLALSSILCFVSDIAFRIRT